MGRKKYHADGFDVLMKAINVTGTTTSPRSNKMKASQPQEKTFNSKYKVRNSKQANMKDIWATVLFILHFIPLIAMGWAGYNFQMNAIRAAIAAHSSNTTTSTGDSIPQGETKPIPNNSNAQPIGLQFDSRGLIGIIAGAFFCGLLLTAVYFWFMRRFAMQVIKVSIFFNMALATVLFVASIAVGNIPGAVIAALYLLILVFMYIRNRHLIPFSSILLETVASVTRQYPATVFAGVISILFQFLWLILWAISAFGTILLFIDFSNLRQERSNGGMTAAILYLSLSYAWTSMVIKNTTHVTNCGLFASYYFQGVDTEGVVTIPVRNPTWESAKRALTTSFGSVVFGSLILALIHTLREAMGMAKASAQENDNPLGAIFCACLQCIVKVIESLIDYLNTYAFAQVAVYGKPYCEAAKDTWALIKSKGVDMIINDTWIGSALSMGSFMVGLLTGCITWGLFAAAYPSVAFFGVALFFAGLFFGASQFSVLAQVIRSGVVITFVCLAEDPDALKRTKPALYQRIHETYHHLALFGA